MEVLNYIFFAILLVVLAPVLLPAAFVLLGFFLTIFFEVAIGLSAMVGCLLFVFGTVLVEMFKGIFIMIGLLLEVCAEAFLFVGKLLISPFLILDEIIDYLNHKWRGLGRQTVAALAGVLVLAGIVLMAYLTRPR